MAFDNPSPEPASRYVVEAAQRADYTGAILSAFKATYREPPSVENMAAAVWALAYRKGDIDLAMFERSSGYEHFSGWYVLAGYKAALAELEDSALLIERLELEASWASGKAESALKAADGNEAYAARCRAAGNPSVAPAMEASAASYRNIAAREREIARVARRHLSDVRASAKVAA